MLEVRVIDTLAEASRTEWDALQGWGLEGYDYLAAVEDAGLEGFRWRYALAFEDGDLVAAIPAFMTDYPLDTTLVGPGRRVVAGLRRLLPSALILRLACLGSPCTETVTLGLAPQLPPARRRIVLEALVDAFEAMAIREGCGLLAVKDVPAPHAETWREAAGRRGYRPAPGLPVAHLDIAFDSIDAYLAGLSAGTRKDMRRKLKAASDVRIEVRGDLDGVLEPVMRLYQETRDRAEMKFEDLTPAYFAGVAERMPGRAFYVLYYQADELLAANLLLEGDGLLLDKFFCMEARRGRPLNLYFLSWFTNLRLCLERGLGRYQAGQAAYANKLRLGCALTPTAMYFRHRNLIVNGALQLVAPLLTADPAADAAAGRRAA